MGKKEHSITDQVHYMGAHPLVHFELVRIKT